MASNWPTLPAFQDKQAASAAALEGWTVWQIDQLYEQLPIGQRRDKKTCSVSGQVPVIDQSAEGCIGYHDENPGVEASSDQPVITFANHTCEMRVMREPFSVIQNVFPMVGADGICDTLFFYYATKGRVNIEEYKGHYPDFRRLWIPVPPLSQQRAIAGVLGSLDDKIELNRRMNRTLESMARALFKSWFVDFDPVHANAAANPTLPDDLAARFPANFETSSLGEIPKGWAVGNVDGICNSITSGGTPTRRKAEFWTGGDIPWFKTGELHDGPLLSSAEQITEAGLAGSSCKLWPKGTVLFALYASPTVGRLGVLTEAGASNQAAAGLQVKVEYGMQFLVHALLEARVKLQQVAVGAAQQNINQRVLKQHEIVLPPGELAMQFNAVVDPLWEKREQLAKESRTLSALRDTLLPRLLSGALRPPADRGT